MARHRALDEVHLPLEVAILLVAALAVLVVGGLLFPVSAGSLPYYEDGVYGLLLVLFALQTVTLGKTPFGDARRTPALVALGAAVAGVGIVTCFVPDLLGDLSRILLVSCFGLGGLTLLLRGVLAPDRFRLWWRSGGVLRHLVVAAASVYTGSVLVGLMLWWQGMLSVPAIGILALVYGAAILYLAFVLRAVYSRYPAAGGGAPYDAGLSTEHAMILLMGIFMLLLGATLIPVNFGALPFAGSAQLGLLMVFFAVQMLATGSTPVGAFPRTWAMVALGLLFAAVGTVSVVVPDVLVAVLPVLVGVLNILSGLVTLAKVGAPFVRGAEAAVTSASPTTAKLFVVQVLMGLVSVLFGASMLVAHLVPGLVLGLVLAANGAVLLYELHLLRSLEAPPPRPYAAEAGELSARGRPTGASPAA